MRFTIVHKGGADLRHTTLGSPQATFKYGKPAPYGCSPNIESLLVFSVVIESLLSNMSCFPFGLLCKGTDNYGTTQCFCKIVWINRGKYLHCQL